MRILLTTLAVLALAGCTNMGLMTGVSAEPSKSSYRCLSGEFTGTYTASKVVGGVLVIPEGSDASDLSPEQIRAIAEALGCRR